MRSSGFRIAFLQIVFLALSILSCDLVGTAAAFPEATQKMQASTIVASVENGQDVAVSNEDSASAVEPVDVPPVISTSCVPMISVTTNSNCRTGFGEPYP